MTVRLGRDPDHQPPAFRALVVEIRAVIRGSRFRTLTEVGEHTDGRPGKRRLSELANGTHFPKPHEVRAVVQACDPRAWPRIEQLYRAAQAERTARQAQVPPHLADRAVVADQQRLPVAGQFTDWTALGIHRPITTLTSGEDRTAEVAAGKLPAYVLRDKDQTDLRPVLAAMADNADSPAVQLVLITGESAAGKTRAAVEAMRAELFGWRLLISHGPRSLAKVLDDHLDLRHTVVWLDEVQELLEQPDGPELLRRLLAVRHGPTVLLATLRSDAEAALHGTAGWQLLDRRARRVALPRRPTVDELARARELDDPWITEAVDRIGDRYGIAEWLAAGPQLVRHLERARDDHPLAAAIVLAAIDCHRAGYINPIPEPLLVEAHRIYLDTASSSRVDPGAFTEALHWARQPVAGASALLEHTLARGDTAFDYLLSYADQERFPPINPQIWPVLLRNATPRTLPMIAVSAQRHAQLGIVAACVPRIGWSTWETQVLAFVGTTDQLSARAEAGDGYAAQLLNDLLFERGDERELVRRADAGDFFAARKLLELLVERGDERGLARRADVGGTLDFVASGLLADLLFERGDADGLAQRANVGNRHAAEKLAELLGERGDEAGLARRAVAGDHYAAEKLVELLHAHGDEARLTQLADAGHSNAAEKLVELLDTHGDEAGLAQLADAGDRYAAQTLAERLGERGDLDALTERAYGGKYYDYYAIGVARDLRRLGFYSRFKSDEQIDLLYEQGDLEALTRLAVQHNSHAVDRLVDLLEDREDVVGLESVIEQFHDWGYTFYRANKLAALLFKLGDAAGLARRADSGDKDAARQLANLLLHRGDEAELARRADAHEWPAAHNLASLLAERGEFDALADRADVGDEPAAQLLADLLAERGDEQQLARRADNGDAYAAQSLTNLLLARGDHDKLGRRADNGDA